jgi:hypothetical protein
MNSWNSTPRSTSDPGIFFAQSPPNTGGLVLRRPSPFVPSSAAWSKTQADVTRSPSRATGQPTISSTSCASTPAVLLCRRDLVFPPAPLPRGAPGLSASRLGALAPTSRCSWHRIDFRLRQDPPHSFRVHSHGSRTRSPSRATTRSERRQAACLAPRSCPAPSRPLPSLQARLVMVASSRRLLPPGTRRRSVIPSRCATSTGREGIHPLRREHP